MSTAGLSEQERARLVALFSAMTDGELAESEREELCETLKASRAARAFYFQLAAIQAGLRKESSRKQAAAEASISCLPECAAEGPAPEETPESPSPAFLFPPPLFPPLDVPEQTNGGFWSGVFENGGPYFAWLTPVVLSLSMLTTIASLAILALVVVPKYRGGPLPLPPGAARPVVGGCAELVRAVNDQWRDAAAAPREGDYLSPGRTLELTAGLVELRFLSGAEVIVEGPAVFEVLSSDLGMLRIGRLAAFVPKQAVGFTVDTPTTHVVDLGTEFGVTADTKGISEVHVFEGEVEAEFRLPFTNDASKPVKRRLGQGQAARFESDRRRPVPIRAVPKAFVRELPSRKAPAYAQAVLADRPSGYWRFEETHVGAPAKDEAGGASGSYGQTAAVGAAGHGRLGRAVRLQSGDASDGVQIPSRGGEFRLGGGYTLEAWVKPEYDNRNGRIFCSDDWGLSYDTRNENTLPDGWKPEAGPRTDKTQTARIPAETKTWRRGLVFTAFGVTDYYFGITLPRDRWSHVVVVVDAQNSAALYVDGVLRKTLRGILPAKRTNTRIAVGGNHINPQIHIPACPWVGEIDEAAVYGHPLSADRVRAHYEAGK